MAKLVGIVLMVVAIYVALTVATEGDGAFGGLFATHADRSAAEPSEAATDDTPAPSSVTSRVRDKMQRTADERADRIDSY